MGGKAARVPFPAVLADIGQPYPKPKGNRYLFRNPSRPTSPQRGLPRPPVPHRCAIAGMAASVATACTDRPGPKPQGYGAASVETG